MNLVFPMPVVQDRHVTQYAFRTRVTDNLVAAMELAAMHNPADSSPMQVAKARARAQMARCFSAEYLDLDSLELRGGFDTATEEDYHRIFLDPVKDSERP